MLTEITLALIQAATEFLPISSSGHLALVSNLISSPNLSLFTALHLASLISVIIFTRKEIKYLLTFKPEALKLWKYLIIATIPAALFGYFAHDLIEKTFSSYLTLTIAFTFTGVILLLTRYTKTQNHLNSKNSLVIGLFQVLALFPGVSRSGMTISAASFLKIPKEKAAKFSFLLFIPLSIGAFIIESGTLIITPSLIASFIICLIASLIFLNFLMLTLKNNKFWMFSFYCFLMAIVSLILYLV